MAMPPPNAPPTALQQAVNDGATFSATIKLPRLPAFPGGNLGLGAKTPTLPFSLCGFKLPSFGFSLGFTIPPFSIDISTLFGIALGISCDGIKSGHPLNFTAGVPWGGGRVGTYDPDPDDD